ncbi:MAG: hypothetical protein R3B09_07275 [Nannocystaceae bacterium]
MDERLRQSLALHGAITLFLGLAAGFPLALVILGDLGGEARAWGMAHMEGVTNGLLLWAVAGIGPVLRLGARTQRVMVWALVLTAYGNALASILGAIADVRGLEPGHGLANTIAYVVYMAAIVAVFAAVALIARGAAPRSADA